MWWCVQYNPLNLLLLSTNAFEDKAREKKWVKTRRFRENQRKVWFGQKNKQKCRTETEHLMDYDVFRYSWLVIFHAVKPYASLCVWQTMGWAIEYDPNEYLIAKVRMCYLYFTVSRSSCACIMFFVCLSLSIHLYPSINTRLCIYLCLYWTTKTSVRPWIFCYVDICVFLYAFALPLFIVDYIIRNDLFVPSSM